MCIGLGRCGLPAPCLLVRLFVFTYTCHARAGLTEPSESKTSNAPKPAAAVAPRAGKLNIGAVDEASSNAPSAKSTNRSTKNVVPSRTPSSV
jgi:hypothetical protein